MDSTNLAEQNRELEGVELELARKTAIFKAALDCIIYMDHEGRILDFNPAAERTFGYKREDVVGRYLAETIIPPSLRQRHWDGLRRYFETGEAPVLGKRLELTGMRSDGTEIPVELAVIRVNVPGPPFFAGFIREISERKRLEERLRRAEERQRFLAEASSVLAKSLDFHETLTTVARLAVPRLADWCAVSIREDDGTVSQLAVAHVDPTKVEQAKALAERYPPDPDSPYGVHAVLRSGQSQLIREIPESMLQAAAKDEEHLRLLRELNLRSAMSVPMIARGKALGVISFISAESDHLYDESDLQLAEDLARRAAIAVDNARLFEERSYVARTLQQSLLPPKLPSVPGVELASLYRPAGEAFEVGGDFYDVFPSTGRTWAVVIGDVCGKGPDAASVTGLARHTIRAAAAEESRPSRILQTLNDAVLQQRTDHTFCTVAYVRMKSAHGGIALDVCCAGHPLPMILRADGAVEAVGAEGTLLGIFPDPELADRAGRLRPGDALVLYTDGLTDQHGPEGRLGRKGIEDALASSAGLDAASIAASLERAVMSGNGQPLQDDVALLVVRVLPADSRETR
ncbi:MAG TPA: SpoIIE family protein phosphatase [Actinomycetota bacterium]|nr:SpoIIE family protein phosphatase [Actinomycetota bacterium]